MENSRVVKTKPHLSHLATVPELATPFCAERGPIVNTGSQINTLLFGSSGPDFCSDNQDSLPKFLFSLQIISGSKPHSCGHHPKTTNEIASQPQQHLHKRQEQKKNNNDITEATTTIQEQQQQQHYTTINEMTNEIASEQQH